MSMVMLTFDENWADEFDIYGWCIVDNALYEDIKHLVSLLPQEEEEWCFGSNEQFYFTPQNMLKAHEPRLLSDMEAISISRIMGGSERGYTAFRSLLDRVMVPMTEEESRIFCAKWL